MTDTIQSWIHHDQELFLWLNGMHTPWLDTLMYWITFKFTWVPMYLVLIVLTIRADKKRGLFMLLSVLLAVLIADKITSGIMKPYFLRFRPCHDPELRQQVHLVTDCGGLYGFASSHASTSFALAITWYTLLKKKLRYIGFLLVWAAIYSYSRIYVGVHYPADLFVGALVGLLSGWFCILLYQSFLVKYYRN